MFFFLLRKKKSSSKKKNFVVYNCSDLLDITAIILFLGQVIYLL